MAGAIWSCAIRLLTAGLGVVDISDLGIVALVMMMMISYTMLFRTSAGLRAFEVGLELPGVRT